MTIASYYIWFIIALCLAGGELLTGTLYLLAVALGVAAGGLTVMLGASVALSLFVAAFISMGIFFLLKRWKKRQYTQSTQLLDIGQLVTVLSWQDSHHARIQYRGTQWDAELIERTHDMTATEYEIAGQKGNIFLIRTKK